MALDVPFKFKLPNFNVLKPSLKQYTDLKLLLVNEAQCQSGNIGVFDLCDALALRTRALGKECTRNFPDWYTPPITSP